MKRQLMLAVSFLMPWVLTAQWQITGTIYDRETYTGIPFALIVASDALTTSGTDGTFSLTLTSPDSTDLIISQLGYETIVFKAAPGGLPIAIALQSKPLQIEEIIVAGTPRYSHPQSDVIADPGHQTTQPRDLGDLFKSIPGFSVVKRGGYALDPVFRGFKYEQLNIIYDGGLQTTNACPARMDPATTHVSPNEVSKIEVLKGPFNVRYGAATGATINIVTENWESGHTGIGGYVEGGYETNGQGKFTQFQLQQNKTLDWLLSASWKDYGNYHSGYGTVVPSSFHALDYSAKLGYDLTPDQRIQVNWRQAAARDILHAGLSMDSDLDDTYILSLDYRWKNITPRVTALAAKVFGSQVNHVMSNTRRPNFRMMEAIAEVMASNYGGRLEATINPGKKTMINTGLDWRALHRDGDRNRLVKRNMMTGELLPTPVSFTDAIWQDSYLDNYGIFAESRHYLNTRWTATAGLRLDAVHSVAREPAREIQELYGDGTRSNELNISGTLSALYEPAEGWQFQLAAGRGVRTANLIERYIDHFTIGMDAYEYVGNPNLKPEANHQIELGLKRQTNRLMFEANVFGALITNYISAVVDPSLPRKFAGSLPYSRRFVNLKKVLQSGFEFQTSLALTHTMSLMWSGSYTRAENLKLQVPVAEIPPLESTIGARYEVPDWWAEGSIRMVAVQNRIATDFDETATPGFQVVDLRAGWKPFSSLSIGVGILNLFNTQYREHLNRLYRNAPESIFIYEPGRNITAFVKYRF